MLQKVQYDNWVWLCSSWLGLELRSLVVRGGLQGLVLRTQLVLVKRHDFFHDTVTDHRAWPISLFT